LIEPSAETFAAPREHHEDEQPSKVWQAVKIFFIVVLVIALVLVVVYVSYIVYEKQKRTKKRFY
jgi:mannose-binding lectin 2